MASRRRAPTRSRGCTRSTRRGAAIRARPRRSRTKGAAAFVELQERGFDVGGVNRPDADARVEALYAHARRALYARIDDEVIRDVSPIGVRARTAAADRDDYLAHPTAGERLRDEDARAVARHCRAGAPHVQLVISDGLNADAVNEQLRALLPPLRRFLSEQGTPGRRDRCRRRERARAGRLSDRRSHRRRDRDPHHRRTPGHRPQHGIGVPDLRAG